MKTILIHGIGNTTPDFAVHWQAATRLNRPVSDLIPLYYEDLMDSAPLSGLTRLAIRGVASYYQQSLAMTEIVLADYLQDVATFLSNASFRRDIATRLQIQLAALDPQEPVTIVGYSLGGLIADWLSLSQPWLTQNRAITLATVGCPLGSPVQGVARLVKAMFPVKPLKRPNMQRFVNVYSALDPLSGEFKNLGCDTQHRLGFDAQVFHTNVPAYLSAVLPLLQ